MNSNSLTQRFRKIMQLANNKTIQKEDTCQEQYDEDNLIESIQLARAEWINANRNFEFAQDKDIIDYYTYQIKASETRYQYLLRLARERSIKLGAKDSIQYIMKGRTISS
jgi:hypothetical protein